MYERSYGYRYGEVADHSSAADIAKLIRRDVKQAQEEGFLPPHWSYSVRSETFAGGCSIDVSVKDCADAWQECDGGQKCRNVWCAARNDPRYAHAAERHQMLTDEADAAKMTLERIHNAYNHDGSEIQVDYHDVRYYGTVTFESADSAQWRKKHAEAQAANKAARENGEIVGKVTNCKRDGSRVTHALVQTTAGNKVLACGSRAWRGAMIFKAADDATVTCSRCAKRVAAMRES